MFRNYIKIALRVFSREKAFTFINITGLAIGLAVTLLIIQYVRFELSYENTHKNADKIVRLTMDYLDGETVSAQDCETYPPIGPSIQEALREVTDFTRVYGISDPTINFKIGEKPFLIDKVYAADASFFSIFNYPLIQGSKENIFKEPNQIVLSESTAMRLYNRLDVVGETGLLPQKEKDIAFKVVGVMKDSPANTHLKINMLLSYPTLVSEWEESDDNWSGNNTYTYVKLGNQTTYEQFTNSLVNFSQGLVTQKKIENERVIGQKITDIHLHSHKTFEPENNNEALTIYFLLGVAFLVIISAFVNYINLATSKALDRAKEVGIRKVVGSTKGQLRAQFFTESALINICAGILALLFIVLAKSTFIELAGLPIGFAIFSNSEFWLILMAFVGLGILFSGAYPALLLSSFKPSAVLKGSYSHSTRGILLRKLLVIFQFAITIILLIQTFTVFEQLNFMRDTDLGVNVERTIVVKAPAANERGTNYSAFKQALRQRADVQTVALSSTVPGQATSQFGTTTGINLPDAVTKHYYNFYLGGIDKDFIEVMDIKLLAGSNFNDQVNETIKEMIVNEKTIELWGIPTPEAAVGRTLNFWGDTWRIKGVIKNYYQVSPKSPHIPIIHYHSNRFNDFASIKFTNDRPRAQIAEIKSVFKTNYPNSPFSFFFLDTEYDKQFKADERFRDVFSILTIVSIIIACLGLFGLASFTVAKRTKEIGVRKVIGASTFSILFLLSKDFLKTIGISMLIGFPITYFLISHWLGNFATRIELQGHLFILPAILIFVLVLLSLSFKTIQTARANPVDCLRE